MHPVLKITWVEVGHGLTHQPTFYGMSEKVFWKENAVLCPKTSPTQVSDLQITKRGTILWFGQKKSKNGFFIPWQSKPCNLNRSPQSVDFVRYKKSSAKVFKNKSDK